MINAYDGLSAGLSESFPAELPQPAWPPSWQVQVSEIMEYTHKTPTLLEDHNMVTKENRAFADLREGDSVLAH